MSEPETPTLIPPASLLKLRPRTLQGPALRALVKRERAETRAIQRELTDVPPRTRGDCADVPRPCPWARCRYHMAVTVTRAGNLQERWPGRELEEMPTTCALDVADEHPDGLTLEEVGRLSNLTRERVRQIEEHALQRAKVLTGVVIHRDNVHKLSPL